MKSFSFITKAEIILDGLRLGYSIREIAKMHDKEKNKIGDEDGKDPEGGRWFRKPAMCILRGVNRNTSDERFSKPHQQGLSHEVSEDD